MEIDLIISWSMAILCLLISIFLIMGKGSFLIAGYNTSSKEEKNKYDKLKLCRLVGIETLIISLIIIIYTYYKFDLPNNIDWIMPYGLLISILITQVLSMIICKKR